MRASEKDPRKRTRTGAAVKCNFANSDPVAGTTAPTGEQSQRDDHGTGAAGPASDGNGVHDALRESEAKYRALFEASPDGILIADLETKILAYANPAVCRMLGYDETELRTMGIADVHPKKDQQWVIAEFEAQARGEKTLAVGLPCLRKDGTTVFADVNATTAVIKGRQCLVGFFRDVTERNQADENLKRALANLERSNKELEQFAYVASHDLQEPLRMVASYTQLLAQRYEGQLDEKAKKYIGYAVEGSLRMQQLIKGLLTFSRAGASDKPMQATDTRAVLEQVIGDLGASIGENGAIVTSDDLPTVRSEASQFAEVLQNLIANAIKFRTQEPPRVHVSARDFGREWIFTVKDNGIGIDPQYKDRVFVIFQRLHTRQEYPGTGIGLALCKRIVEWHGGRIWFESEPGKGSTFCFTIPKQQSES